MKSLWVFAFLVCMSGFTLLFAQESAGILGGLNFANNSIEPAEGNSYETRTAIVAAGVFTADVVDNLSVQIEPMFIQKGTQFDSQSITSISGSLDLHIVDAVEQIKLTYFSLAVLGRINLFNSPLYLLAGPDIGYLRSAVIGFDLEDASDSNIKDFLNEVDFGLNFGITAFIPGNKHFLVIEALYNMGLKDISLDEDATIKNNGIQLKLGFAFPLDKR